MMADWRRGSRESRMERIRIQYNILYFIIITNSNYKNGVPNYYFNIQL